MAALKANPARQALGALAALLACALAAAPAAAAPFHHGVIGVRLSAQVGEDVAWSSDGSWIAEPSGVGLRLRNIESGEIRPLRAPAYLNSQLPPSGPLDWAPDGTIRYLTSPTYPPIAGSNASTLTVVRVDGSGFRRQRLDIRSSYTDWALPGWPLVFAAGPFAFSFEKGPIGPRPSLFVLDQFGAMPRRIALIPHPTGEEDLVEPSVSPDGTRIAYKRWGRNGYGGHSLSIWTIGTDGSGLRPLIRGLNSASTVEWSPDGSKIALGAHTGVRSGQRVYVVPATGGGLARIVDEEVLDGPAWSPDGQWLAFSNYDGEIWRLHPDGSGRQRIATIPDREVRDLLWSPDSRHLAYVAAPLPHSD
ncbi:MAG: TolB family protein [Solirubrobacterales bacterium]